MFLHRHQEQVIYPSGIEVFLKVSDFTGFSCPYISLLRIEAIPAGIRAKRICLFFSDDTGLMRVSMVHGHYYIICCGYNAQIE